MPAAVMRALNITALARVTLLPGQHPARPSIARQSIVNGAG
jgi:hypothetical protein